MPDLMVWGAMELSKLKNDLDRRLAALCDDFGLARAARPAGEAWISHKDGEWVIHCPLPGFAPEDVAVAVSGPTLSITATRAHGQGGGMARVSQELTMPFVIGKARAEFEAGVLTVRLERQALSGAQAIPVARGRCDAERPCAADATATAPNDRSNT